MVDIFTKKKRSEVMSKVRSKGTKPELKLKKALRGTYLRYQPKNISGKPDFASKKKKIAIFVDSCFWHGCPKHYKTPKSNKRYWIPKIEGNKRRDKLIVNELKKQGYQVIRIWEHALREDIKKHVSDINRKIGK